MVLLDFRNFVVSKNRIEGNMKELWEEPGQKRGLWRSWIGVKHLTDPDMNIELFRCLQSQSVDLLVPFRQEYMSGAFGNNAFVNDPQSWTSRPLL